MALFLQGQKSCILQGLIFGEPINLGRQASFFKKNHSICCGLGVLVCLRADVLGVLEYLRILVLYVFTYSYVFPACCAQILYETTGLCA